MYKYTLDECNLYGLTITQNTDSVYTISNKSGETFIAEFRSPNCILLRHWNYRACRGHTHKQGTFQSIESMLRDVHSHGNRLMKPPKKRRIDYLFDQIEGKSNGKMFAV